LFDSILIGFDSLAFLNATVSCGGVEGERAWNFALFSLSFLICFSFVFFYFQFPYAQKYINDVVSVECYIGVGVFWDLRVGNHKVLVGQR
jgi:hypothetical protein